MKISLDAKNKLGFLDGSLIRPSIDDRYFKIWSRCNSMVKSWLLNVVNKEIYDSILYYEDAAEMWDDFFRRFKVNNLPRKYQLEQAVMTLKQGDSDLSTYFTKKKTLWEQLANTKSSLVKKCNCDQVKELLEDAETSRIIQFLMGLNDSFNKICGQILNMKPPPLLNDIYNMLDQDESQRSIGHSLKSVANPSAFQIQSSNLVEQPHTLLAQTGYQKPKCSHCHKMGHTADKCYKLHGYPPGSGPPKLKKPQTIGSTNLATLPVQVVSEQQTEKSDHLKEDMSRDQIQTMISYLSSKLHGSHIKSLPDKSFASTSTFVHVISQISGTFLDLYSKSYYDMLVSSVSTEPAVSLRAWVLDSGATHHVSHNKDLYIEYRSLENTYVTLPNGYTVHIEGIGFIQLTDDISLHNVLYIPEFKFNLISVSVLTKTLNSKVSFTSDQWFIQELTRELMIGQGSQVGNLYVMDFNKNTQSVCLQDVSTTCSFPPVCSSFTLIHLLGIIDWVIHLAQSLMFFLICCVSKG